VAGGLSLPPEILSRTFGTEVGERVLEDDVDNTRLPREQYIWGHRGALTR
jgi:hypothetical protein